MTLPRQTLINGKWLDAINVRDRGLAYGDGLFETLLYQSGRLPLLQWHMERLTLGLARLGIPQDPAAIEDNLAMFTRHLEQQGETRAILKVMVTRGCGGQGYKPPQPADTQPTLIIQSQLLSPADTRPQTGIVLQVCRTRIAPNPLLAGLKHLNRLDYVLAAQELPDDASVQGLLLDTGGRLLECLHHNLFLVTGRELKTPRLLEAGVHGVMRRVLMERLAPELGLVGVTEDLELADLTSADEVFICNSVRGLWPVRTCNDRHWALQGPITLQLQSSLNAMLDELVA